MNEVDIREGGKRNPKCRPQRERVGEVAEVESWFGERTRWLPLKQQVMRRRRQRGEERESSREKDLNPDVDEAQRAFVT